MTSRAVLQTLSKEQLINQLISAERQRKSAWKMYFQTQEIVVEDRSAAMAAIRKVTENKTDDAEKLRALLLKYVEKYEADKLECPICQETPDSKDATITCCGHCFCRGCIKEWQKTSEVCPMCRSKIKWN